MACVIIVALKPVFSMVLLCQNAFQNESIPAKILAERFPPCEADDPKIGASIWASAAW